ncbi:MAG: S26 family signal peptidase [Candidatus Kerfeldbacteria bacterium]|nr:S26 family signal peptidase [Candidatus Kerfeldbacteria bacterium]
MLREGDQVFVKRVGKSDQLEVGDIVVARHPFQKMFIIKRIDRIHDEQVFLVGMDRASTDGWSFGGIARERIIGKVTAHLPRLTDELRPDTLLT